MARELEFLAIDDERRPGAWAAIFARYWPLYRAWYRRAEAPPARACRTMLERHMPELVPIQDALLDRLDEPRDGTVARFLTLFAPPVFACACTQLILPDAAGGPALVRNYDFDPDLCDGVVLRSVWNDVSVLATTDCLIGALDGVNAHGLAVALAFGGRRVVGSGFGIQLVVRYLLETCATVAEAGAALRRIPVHMAHTVALVDRSGAHATVFVSPDRGAEVRDDTVSTNHQGDIEWPEHAERTGSAERYDAAGALADLDADTAAARFVEPPLFRTGWCEAAGTVYTVAIETAGRMRYRWRDGAWDVPLDGVPEEARTVVYA